MAEYFTAASIASRLGIHPHTLMFWYREYHFPMYTRRATAKASQAGVRAQTRGVWYTNDDLIARWQLARCEAERRERMQREGRGALRPKGSEADVRAVRRRRAAVS